MTVSMLLLGIAVFLFMPFALLPIIVIGYINSKSGYRVLFCILVSILFGIAGYCFINPATDPDLVRYMQMLDLYKGKSLSESFNLVYQNLYAVDIYFHIISSLGNAQLLPAISVFLFYFIAFYIIQDYRMKSGIKKIDYMICSAFVACTIIFCSIVNGIRWPLSFAIFILAFYREIVQGKKNWITWVYYIIALLFHFSTIVLLILRLLLFVKNKKIIVLVGISGMLVPHLFNILADYTSRNSSKVLLMKQLEYFFRRGNSYFRWHQTGWDAIVRNSGYYKMEAYCYYVIVAIFAVCFYILYGFRKKRGGQNQNWKSEDIFIFYLMVATVISFTMSAHTYIRFVTPFMILK